MEPVHSAPPASSGVVRLLVKLAFAAAWLSPHGFRVPSANFVRTFRNARVRASYSAASS